MRHYVSAGHRQVEPPGSLGDRERVPDHSWLSRTRSRLPLEVHDKVFTWVLARLGEHGLIKGERIGLDGSTVEASAALRAIVRRDSGEGYRELLARMARESGIETPMADDLIRLDRNRKGKKLSSADWKSPTDPDARIAKLKDGRTRLAFKPEHAMDLDTGAVIAADLHRRSGRHGDHGGHTCQRRRASRVGGRGANLRGARGIDRGQWLSRA
jgi:transposase